MAYALQNFNYLYETPSNFYGSLFINVSSQQASVGRRILKWLSIVSRV